MTLTDNLFDSKEIKILNLKCLLKLVIKLNNKYKIT